ncbi:hypothetical protein EDB87DRAFT_1578513 [Lactarius vividus]|nr:hypothetical protein EDB87DRAFT_1578513 [Lactarius vividus]
MDEVGRLTRRSGAFAVREEDAELGYGQGGGGNVSVGKRCSRRDEPKKEKKRKSVADVEGKASRVDGARCALRMRRGNATVSARQDMRYADALQTRSHENTRCRVPRTVSRPSEGGRPHQNLDWCRGAHANIPAWKSRAQWSEGPQTPLHRRREHAAGLLRDQILDILTKSESVMQAGVRDVGKIKAVGVCTDYRIGWLVISAKVERMSVGERRPAGKNKCNIRGRYTRAREIEGSARYKPDRNKDRAP